MIVGITGGSGSGKTTLLGCLAQAGALVLDCDQIYHRLLRENPALLRAIGERFPGTVQNGVLDRKKLGNLVFSNENALSDLNRITHSAVKAEVLRLLEAAPGHTAIDAIGLFEGGLGELCQVTVAVIAPEEDRIRRLMQRDGISRDYALSRIRAQHPDSWFREKCTHCLENRGTISEFRSQCLAFLQEIGIIE